MFLNSPSNIALELFAHVELLRFSTFVEIPCTIYPLSYVETAVFCASPQLVHLVDAHLCSDPGKYIDLIESYGKLAFNIDFYTDVQDLSYLQNELGQYLRSAKYRKLTKELCEVIEDYGLVNFTTLDIQDKESIGNLVKLIDKSNGYIFAGIDASAVGFSKIAVGPVDWDYYRYPFSCHLTYKWTPFIQVINFKSYASTITRSCVPLPAHADFMKIDHS
ncbi:hypothetical protein CQW23_10765 [Capsicum baccatum]|uniref:GPN-loop GTPase 2 n=1 Tax=Capsicum baccatum TaxID=33114 RepID=A0A2G2X0J4_CAPBA|nr:hypothetical protein CQW23_10765 [Capsicum baccatum]